MITETELIELKKGLAIGVKINLGNANFLLIKAEKGYAVCAYFNKEVIEKLNDCAVQVSEVKDFKHMLIKKIEYLSPKARKLGINKRMTVRQALEKMV